MEIFRRQEMVQTIKDNKVTKVCDINDEYEDKNIRDKNKKDSKSIYTSDANRELGNRIRYHRKAKKMTITELAEKVGLHFSTVQKYEAGKIKNVDVSLIQRFADALDIDDNILLGWDDKKKEVSTTITNSLNKDTIDYKFMKLYSTLNEKQKETLLLIASNLKNE